MMRALNFTLFTILLSASFLMAQDCLSSMYFFPVNGIYPAYGISTDTTLDNGFISAAGYENPGSVSINDIDIAIVKSDVFGNEVWTQTYVWEGKDLLAAIKQLPDGGYIVLGTTSSPSLTNAKSSILLFKIDESGGLLWTSVLGTGTNQKYVANDLELLPDGGFLIAGSHQGIMVIMKTDANGAMTAENTINPPVVDIQFGGGVVNSYTQGGDVFLAANGDYLFSGISYPNTSSWPVGAYMTVVRTTPDLNIIWTSVSSYSLCHPLLPKGGVEYNDGSLYVTATSEFSCSDVGVISKLVKLDESGNVLWSEHQHFGYTGDLLIASDGNLVMSRGNGIVKVDTSGAVIWESPRVSYLGYLNPNSTGVNTQTGGYTIVGSRENLLVLVEFDSLGNNCSSIASGVVYIDNDQDCIKDSSEVFFENAILEVTPDQIFTNTNGNGLFQFLLDTGSFNLQLHPPNALWEVGCPLTTTYDFSFSIPYQTQNNLDFGLHALESCALLNVDVSLPRARVCTEQSISVSYCNEGTISQSGVVIVVELDEILEFQNAGIPWTQSGNTYSFDIGDLSVEECGQFNLTVFVDCEVEIGNTTCVLASILPENTCTLEEGHDQDADCRELVNSYDPNDKIAIASDTNSCWETALDELAFTIRFQNTGNDTAYRVVIIDTLSSVLDLSTVRPGPSSHPYDFKVSGHNQLMFVFNAINLLDSSSNEAASQGFVQFFIHPKSNIVEGTVIENQAAIYFDTNDPIFTSPVQLPQCGEVSLTVVNVASTPVTDCISPDGALSIIASGGDGAYEYSVNGGGDWQPSPEFTGLLDGVYHIRVRDGNGNAVDYFRNPVEIEKSIPIILNVQTDDPHSCGGVDGRLEIDAFSLGNILYSIDGGTTFQEDALFTGLSEGLYQIMAYNECQEGDTLNIVELSDPEYPQFTGVTWQDPECDSANGFISMQTSGGFGRKLSINGGETWNASSYSNNLPPGEYQVMVSYGEGNCEVAYDSLIILANGGHAPDIQDVVIDLASQCEGVDASLEIISTGTFLEYSIDGGITFQQSATFTGLAPGVYGIVVRNDCGISDTLSSVSIENTPSPQFTNVYISHPGCGVNDGIISWSVSGGDNLEFSVNGWGNTQEDTLVTGLTEGVYLLNARNEYGCYANSVIVELVNELPPVLDSVNFVPPSGNMTVDGYLEIFADGVGSLLYSIDEGASWQPSSVFTDLAAGIYSPWVSTEDTTCIVMGDPIELMSPTSTLDFKDENIQSLLLYPNPGREIVKLDIQLKQPAEIKWKITALSGATIKAFGETVNTVHLQEYIPIGQLTAGVYALHVNIDGHNYIRRLVVY